VLARFNFDTF